MPALVGLPGCPFHWEITEVRTRPKPQCLGPLYSPVGDDDTPSCLCTAVRVSLVDLTSVISYLFDEEKVTLSVLYHQWWISGVSSSGPASPWEPTSEHGPTKEQRCQRSRADKGLSEGSLEGMDTSQKAFV